MGDYWNGVLIGSGWAIGLAAVVFSWLQEREHRAWCKMFDRLHSAVVMMAERLRRPEDDADWWKQS